MVLFPMWEIEITPGVPLPVHTLQRDEKFHIPQTAYPAENPVNGSSGSFVIRFRAGQAFSQERDLAHVMRLVLANMEPLAVIIGRPPEPVFVDGHEPGII